MKSKTGRNMSANSHGVRKPSATPSATNADGKSSDKAPNVDSFDDFDVLSGSEKDFLLEALEGYTPRQDMEAFKKAQREAETVDLFVGFNVDPREKQFLLEILAHYTPDEHIRMLEEAGEDEVEMENGDDQSGHVPPDRNYWNDTIEQHLILRNEVEAFSQLHAFVADKNVRFSEPRFRHYVRDIYDYARAIGMGHYQAILEVKRTRTAYRQKRGLAKHPWLEEFNDKSSIGLTIDHNLGPLDPAVANAEIARLHLKCILGQTHSRKRKRTDSIPQSSSDERESRTPVIVDVKKGEPLTESKASTLNTAESTLKEKGERYDRGRKKVKTETEVHTPTKSETKAGSTIHRKLRAPDSTPSESDESSGEQNISKSQFSKKAVAKPITQSPYFSPPATVEKPRAKKSLAGLVSCIPFPPLKAERFGLLQEKLADDPLRLLIGVFFLNRTHGKDAIPVFFQLMDRYPTPEALAAARKEDVVSLIYHLGFQSIRAEKYIKLANHWIHDPPVKGRRHRVVDYPDKGSHVGIMKNEILDDADPRVGAWEIGHITCGRYALDSWRIFCRDKLRGLADGWNGEGAEGDFQPEWMRVVPEDKELRAFLRWMWLKEGFDFDPITGEKEVASKELMEAAMEGRIAWDDLGGMRILDEDELIPDIPLEEGSSASASEEESEESSSQDN